MSQFDELRSLLLEWGEDYRLRMQNQRIHERNERLTLIVKKRREEVNQ